MTDTKISEFMRQDIAGVDAFKTLSKEAPVKEFVGIIDGGGYKRSFDDPKKVPLDLIPPTLALGIGRVLAKGAKKYAPGNWLRGMSWSGVVAAIERHLKAIQAGEDVDTDTGELHIYCIGCEIAFLSWFMEGPWKEEYARFDDRMFDPERLTQPLVTPPQRPEREYGFGNR